MYRCERTLPVPEPQTGPGPFVRLDPTWLESLGAWGNHIGKQLAREALRYGIYVLRFYFIDSTIEADSNARPIK